MAKKGVRIIERYIKTNQSFLREYNKKKVLNILREQGALSRIELAEISQLDRKSITNIVNDLFKSGQIINHSTQNVAIGRPREMLIRNGNFTRCLGIDLGSTHITAVIMDFIGNILATHTVEPLNSGEPLEVIALMEKAVAHVLEEAKIELEDIESVGIAFPGRVDLRTNNVFLAESMPKWQGIPMRELFEGHFGKPVMFGDCSMLIALAELRYGQGKDCKDFIVFDLGFGIGCGIVINGEIFSGCCGKAGEIGHTIVQVDGPECTCGRRGCIEALASGWALAKQAETLIQNNPQGILARISQGNKEVFIQDVVAAAQQGDEDCKKILVAASGYIGVGISNAMMLFNPKKVIIAGRMIIGNDIMLDEINKAIQEKASPVIYDDARIVTSQMGHIASAIGAATLCLEHYYI